MIQILKRIETKLTNIEKDKSNLSIEIHNYQKKLHVLEENFVDCKKQYLELEDEIKEVCSHSTGFINRIKSFFK